MAFSAYSGPVIRGYIADVSGVLTACEVGEFQPSFYGTECKACMKGRYCPNEGMTNIASFLCKEGYWCDEGITVSTPSGLSNGDECSVGKFCSGGLIHEQDCQDGFYSDVVGLSICTTCPAGYFCDSAVSVEPTACIKNSECDLGIKRQPICPPGMYKYTSSSGAE